MKKYKNLMWACLALLAVPAGAQDTDNNVRGMVVDKWGHPVYGASVMVKGMPETRVETDKDGKFFHRSFCRTAIEYCVSR
mgnify:CR=1 FL=1